MQTRHPNFFIIGAPKCGTTALATYLKEHPSFFMSSPKEPHFFAPRLRPWFFPAKTEADYLELFKEVSPNATVLGEASVLYLYTQEAIDRIHTFNPEARLVVMLRNPVELVQSWHSQAVYNGDETVVEFEEAWRLQGDRASGKQIPPNCRIPEVLQYSNIGRLGTQLQHVYKVFPKEQVHVILLEDFKKDTGAAYRGVFRFMGLPEDDRSEFPVINENKVLRSKALKKMKQSSWYGPLRKLKKMLGLGSAHLMKPVESRLVKKVQRKPLSPELRTELTAHFKGEIELLEALLNRSLKHWKDE